MERNQQLDPPSGPAEEKGYVAPLADYIQHVHDAPNPYLIMRDG